MKSNVELSTVSRNFFNSEIKKRNRDENLLRQYLFYFFSVEIVLMIVGIYLSIWNISLADGKD